MAYPITMTLEEIRDAAKQHADMVNSGFLTDDEWNTNINNSLTELFDVLVTCYGDAYFTATPFLITTDGTNERYALPADFYKALGVELWPFRTASGAITLRTFAFGERNQYSAPGGPIFGAITVPKYRLDANYIWFIPRPPPSGLTLYLNYVPRMEVLDADDDVADGYSGWLEYVIVDAALKAIVKEESDPQALMAQKAALLKRIEGAAPNRDAGSASTVMDVTLSGGWWNGTFNGGGYGGGGVY